MEFRQGEYIKDLRMVFEIPDGRRIDFFEEKERIIRDMKQFLELVDILRLDN